jgi:hypothetical protein
MQDASGIFASQGGASRVAIAAMLIWVPIIVGSATPAVGQEAAQGTAVPALAVAPIIPQQVHYAGKLATGPGETVEAEFRIYAAAEGGDPLWTEKQRVTVGEDGSYSVLLGSANPSGLLQTIFAGGAARWLGVSVERAPEQERVLLSSVPYAMKAADAESLSGHAASDFVTQGQLAQLAQLTQASKQDAVAPEIQPNTPGTVTGSGTSGTVPLWTGTLTQGNSEITQVGPDIGINEAMPAATLDVNGTAQFRGNVTLPGTGTATTSSGHESQTLNFAASGWSSTENAPVSPAFQMFAYPVNNNTANPTAKFYMQYRNGSTTTTLFSVNSEGIFGFAAGQTFPGAITSVTGTSPVTAAKTAGAVSLGLDTSALATTLNSAYAQLGSANTFTQNQTMTQGLTVSGTASANLVNATTGYQLDGAAFASGNPGQQNVSLGFSSSPSEAGQFNVGIGPQTLSAVTSGSSNTAVGGGALNANLGGAFNTAVGDSALNANRSGNDNVAVGVVSLLNHPSGNDNTAIGGGALKFWPAGDGNTAVGNLAGYTINGQPGGNNNTFIGYWTKSEGTVALTDAAAIGANAIVGESNALILGGTGGDAVSVGIGTSTPFNDYALDVEATTNNQINSGVVVNANGGNLYLGMTSGTHKFRVDTNGNVHAGAYETTGADFAESVAVRGKRSAYEPGDLLVIDPRGMRRLALAQSPYSTRVAGIFSTKPGMLATPHNIDNPRPDTTEVPLAVVGIVPCKVTAENGPIQAGDLLVASSRPGYAMKGTDRRRMLGAVVGKALEPLSKGSGPIQVLVTLQ